MRSLTGIKMKTAGAVLTLAAAACVSVIGSGGAQAVDGAQVTEYEHTTDAVPVNTLKRVYRSCDKGGKISDISVYTAGSAEPPVIVRNQNAEPPTGWAGEGFGVDVIRNNVPAGTYPIPDAETLHLNYTCTYPSTIQVKKLVTISGMPSSGAQQLYNARIECNSGYSTLQNTGWTWKSGGSVDGIRVYREERLAPYLHSWDFLNRSRLSTVVELSATCGRTTAEDHPV
ncbi:hypothetical protein [Streptomyces sp. NPDC058664]|uniref:hypothetical protein n=1 Tax=unclassified Streptomyces TaxID=2593676 RepID=UPI003661277D